MIARHLELAPVILNPSAFEGGGGHFAVAELPEWLRITVVGEHIVRSLDRRALDNYTDVLREQLYPLYLAEGVATTWLADAIFDSADN